MVLCLSGPAADIAVRKVGRKEPVLGVATSDVEGEVLLFGSVVGGGRVVVA